MGTPRSTPAKKVVEREEGRRHEVLGILTGTAAVLLALALWSYDARGGDNLIGPVGAAVAGVAAGAFGLAAWWLPLELGMATAHLFRRRETILGLATLASTLVFLLVGCSMLHLVLRGQEVFGGHPGGGALGEVLGEVLLSLLGVAGAYLIGLAVLLMTAVLRAPISLMEVLRRTRVVASRVAARWARKAWASCRALWSAWREAKAVERAEREKSAKAAEPKIIPRAADSEADTTLVDAEPHGAAAKKGRPRGVSGAPRIVAPVHLETPPLLAPTGHPSGPFTLPPTSLLDPPPASVIPVDADSLRDNAAKLIEKLEAYGVKGRVDEIHPGPVVTMYEVEPQSGTKVSKIAGLADDLAMALAAQKVRIVAPIPGKARVGFELPNETRQTVYLRQVLEDRRWQSIKAQLPVALGQDIAGQPVYCDLSKMPHLLVAGATGAGKSVGINVMLVSLLAKKTPEEVRLLMIDPKVVELAVFDKIPHMLLPVVTDMKKAALALRWAVDEMERRYQLFADAGSRSILSYNQRVQQVLDGTVPREKLGAMHSTPTGVGAAETEDAPPIKLPHVVLVVDEFADLMMVAAKDVEAAIARLAQKARAAGIHVILATQRPSVDVITGMIKANFPARMAYKTAQREDSKTILGRSGAEHLLGMGDMLMIPPGTSDLTRVHCAYVSEDEVKRVCDHLRAQGTPVYHEDILKPRDDDEEGGLGGGTSSDDPQYDRAVAVVAQAGYCSISHIQRQLSVGYNKAAKLVERMEREGVVGPPSGKAGGRREVLIQAL